MRTGTMTEEDKFALKEFLQGVAVVFGLMAVIILGVALLGSFGESESGESTFKVVDSYEGCAVVRYAPSQASTYKYFLHCEGTK